MKWCSGTTVERIHRVLWKEFLKGSDKTDFVERAESIINLYIQIQENNREYSCCCC